MSPASRNNGIKPVRKPVVNGDGERHRFAIRERRCERTFGVATIES